MKKVVFVLPAIAGGGAERVVLNLYKAMETYTKSECHILTLSRKITHEINSELRIHYIDEAAIVSKKGINRLTYRKKTSRIVDDYIDKNIGKDCIILSNMMFVDKIMSLSRHNVFHIIHSAYTQSLLEGRPSYQKFFIKKNINNIYSHHPMIFVSKGAYNSFCENFKTPVDKQVIYNPVNDLDIYALSNSEKINLDYDYIIHVGRFNRAKRHDRLLKAFVKTNSNIKLLLLGEGKLESNIKNLIKNLGLDERVQLMGFKKNPYPYIKNAKALISTSDFEGLPTVIIEAISLGVPVIATDCPGGIREIIDIASPSLIPLNNPEKLIFAMDDVLINPESYKCLLDQKFSSEFVAAQYDNLFN